MAEKKGIDSSLYMEKPEKPKNTIVRRIRLYTYMLLILIIIGMYVWRMFSVQNLEKRLDAQRTEMIHERQEAVEVQAQSMLRMTAQPLAWAVRAEMMRDNLSQVDDYFRDLVRAEGVTSIFLIDRENQVAIATNRKFEGQPAESVASQDIRNAKGVVIEPAESGVRMGIPIMSFNEKIGILVMDYTPQDFQATTPDN
jgi:hypothetical protein